MSKSLAVVAAALIGLAGCSSEPTGTDPSSSPSPSPSPTQSPSVDAPTAQESSPAEQWANAVANTRGQASLESQLITNVEGFERIVAGVGVVDIDAAFGDITWSDELATTREIQSVDGHFLELDGTWFTLDSETGVPTKVGFSPLRGLDTADNITRVGLEQVLGVETTRFEASLDPAIGASIMGFSGEEMTVLDEATPSSLVATIWVDDQGRMIRILREYQAESADGDPISATTMDLLNSFSEPSPINVPETADAIPAPI